MAGKSLAQVAISFNKRTYRFECADGEAERLEMIAGYLKDKLDVLLREHGPAGDERLVLMAALMLTDELFEARSDIDELLEEETGKLRALSETVKGMRGGSTPDQGRKTGS
ncbi:MAG: cell division protein ZapA [Hyphomicrobium sp.]